MLDFTFLKEDQIWGDDALDVMKKYGTAVAPTDLTVILGGYMTGSGDHTSEDDPTCASWSASSMADESVVRCVDSEGDLGWDDTDTRRISARPALSPSEASKISPSIAGAIAGIRVAEYGEYPQTVADKETSEKLEGLHDSKSLCPTGKSYTFDSVGIEDYDTPFKAVSYPEYEMDGKRYIRVLGHPANHTGELSTGGVAKEGKPYWVEVQPIEWLMDESGWMVAKKCLFAGIQFNTNKRYNDNFYKTFMKHYLDTYFAKEMEPTNTKEQVKTASNEQKPVEKKTALKAKLAVTSKGKNDPAVALTAEKPKGSGYSLTDKSDGTHIAVAAKRSRSERQ